MIRDQIFHEIEHCVYDVVYKELIDMPELTLDECGELSTVAAYQAMKRYRKLHGQVYFCCHASCPGYPYKASNIPHPSSTCCS